MTNEAQLQFWREMSDDLEILLQASRHLMERQAVIVLADVIAAAQAEIAQYRILLATERRRPA